MSRFVRACLRRAVPHQARGMLQDCALYNWVQKHCVGAVRIEAAYKPSPNSKDSLLEYPVHRGMSVVPVYLILYDGVLVDFSLVLIAPVASNCLNIDKTLRFYDSRRWDPEEIVLENNDNLRLFPYGQKCPREAEVIAANGVAGSECAVQSKAATPPWRGNPSDSGQRGSAK